MSDLRHKSPTELREIISRGEAYRAKRYAEADAHDANASALEAAALELRKKAQTLRMEAGNSYQRTVWAKTYLARKETGQCN